MKAQAMFRIVVLLAGLTIVFTGCGTFNAGRRSGLSIEDQQRERLERQKHDEDRRAAQERDDELRSKADNDRRAHDRQRDEARQLREKFEKYSTAELKVIHERYLQVATGAAGGRDLNVRVNSFLPSESDKKQMDRVVEIERELLRRWKAGDSEAKLPNF
jgi:hypothetical protein